MPAGVTWFGALPYLLESYRPFHKLIYLTEWGFESHTAEEERIKGQYVTKMLDEIAAQPDIPLATYFCHTDQQVNGCGLLDANHQPKPAWRSFNRWLTRHRGARRPQGGSNAP